MTEGNSYNQQHTSQPSSYYYKWDTLKGLFEDQEGMELFNRYVQIEVGKHYKPLVFYICCEGLKQQRNDVAARDCILAIYRRFLRKNQISIPITDNFKEKIASIKSRNHTVVDRHIFDSMQEEALQIIYQNFFMSDVYIQHIRNAKVVAQVGCASSSRRSGSGQLARANSNTMSANSLRDSRPYVESLLENNHAIQINVLNDEDTNPGDFTPLMQRPKKVLSTEELLSQLLPKLYKVSLDQSAAINQGPVQADSLFERLQFEYDNDQSILDQHVSRVWSDLTPHRSPGTSSPRPAVPNRRQTHDSVNNGDSGQSMRHSKSMLQHTSSSKGLTNRWPSVFTDSGISLGSMDATLRSRDLKCSSRSTGIDSASTSTAIQLEEEQRRLEDQSRRSHRYYQHPPKIHQQIPTLSSATLGSTVAVYMYSDEDLPYRSKLPGCRPTLRQFKENLPKKGNFRFFFKTACEDPNNPIVQEEIVNDDEILPLFEGKVMGLVKQ